MFETKRLLRSKIVTLEAQLAWKIETETQLRARIDELESSIKNTSERKKSEAEKVLERLRQVLRMVEYYSSKEIAGMPLGNIDQPQTVRSHSHQFSGITGYAQGADLNQAKRPAMNNFYTK